MLSTYSAQSTDGALLTNPKALTQEPLQDLPVTAHNIGAARHEFTTVSRSELPSGFACTMPEHDAYALVFGCFIEDAGESLVHARSHRVSLSRTIQLNAENVSGSFGNDLVHRPAPAST
jgi:hypothetical protein